MLTPIVESLATDLAGRAKVCKIDIDEAPNTSQKMGVRGVPTVIAFKNGEKTGSLVGLTTKEKLLKLLE
jgi:thioredoxin 1